MAIKLLAVDLDGTLLNDEGRASDQDITALRTAIENGIVVVPVTGRHVQGAGKALGALFPLIGYIIAVNGARAYDLQKNETLYRADISPEEAEAVFDYLDSLPVIYEAFLDDQVMMPSEHLERMDMFSLNPGRMNGFRASIRPIEHFRIAMKAQRMPLVKIQVLFNNPQFRLEQLQAIPKRFPQLNVTSAHSNNAEISGKDASKGKALQVLCSHLGFGLDETMAIGDNINDISMLKIAGISVAMGNASREICRGVSYVTGSNNESGVAKAIARFLGDRRDR